MEKPRQSKEDKAIEAKIKTGLEQLEAAPSPLVWEKISSQLKLANLEFKEKKPVPWYRSLGFAAAVLLVLGMGSSFIYSRIFAPEEIGQTAYRPLDMLELEMEASSEPLVNGIMEEAAVSDSTLLEPGITALEEAERPAIRGTEDAPDKIMNYFLRTSRKSTGRIKATYYLYSGQGEEFWLVVADYPFTIIGDFPVEEGRYIPEETLSNINVDQWMNLVRDNTGKNAIIWVSNNKMYILWAKTDTVTGVDLADIRRLFP